ncbi:MAG: histidine kinase [Flavobacteriales bacterium]|nr:histidine kinase [Flavobacteriales bacterium]
MIHLRLIFATAILAMLLCTPFCAFAQEGTNVCSQLKDSIDIYSFRYDQTMKLRGFGQQFADCAEENNLAEEHAEALSVIGVTYMRENDFDTALYYFFRCNKESLELNDSIAAGQTLINIGSVYMKLDSFPQASEYLLEAAVILEAKQDSASLVYVYNSLAILMGQIGNKKEQVGYNQLAFDMVGRKMDSKRALGVVSNLFINLANFGKLDTAEILGLQVLKKAREMGAKKTIAQALAYLSNIAYMTERYELAVTYAEESINFEDKIRHRQTFSSAYSFYGNALIALGRNKEAIAAFSKALHYAKRQGSMSARKSVYNKLHLAYSAEGRFEEAYAAHQMLSQLRDSLLREENVLIVNELQTKYETEKKEQQLVELNQKNRINELKVKQRNTWIIVLVILALLIAATIFFVSRQRLLKQQQKTLENRLLSLRVQLNPHFIFNALTAVQNYMLSGKDLREATKYLSNFAKVMRAFLEYNQEEQISLDKELHALDLYVGIQKLRFSNGFDFDIETDDDMIPEEVMVPPMIMQPLIENAIEHGIRNTDNGHISLRYTVDGDSLVMTVSDNGIGRRKAALENPNAEGKTSLATKITEERISLLNRQSKGKYSFDISDKNADGTGTVVTFRIPFLQL